MKIKDLRRVIEILAPLDDDTSVNIDFGGFTMDNDFIESVEICNDGESEYCSRSRRRPTQHSKGNLSYKIL